jgi:TATA-binding protein-associated factor Taf7
LKSPYFTCVLIIFIMSRQINIAKVVAFIIKKNRIPLSRLQSIIDSPNLNIFELMMYEQINKQLHDEDLIISQVESLDVDLDDTSKEEYAEPDDSTFTFNDNDADDDDDDDDGDNNFNDPDWQPSPKKPRLNNSTISQELWIKAYRFWTKQLDTRFHS